jgi:gas vesicle protein
MANQNNIGGGAIMAAFFMGALAGAAVALLFAPASGEETREYLGEKAREGRARAREAVDEGRAYYKQQRENLTRAVERGREAFDEARERGGQQA